ncbi:MAG: hypothetical protein WBI38_03335, partial [Bacillota bacterium]
MGNDSAGFSAKLLDIDNGRTIIIDNARNANELDSVLRLVGVIFPPQPDGESKYTHEFWAQRLGERPELLLYARDGDVVCGSVFAWAEGNGSVTIALCSFSRRSTALKSSSHSARVTR